MQEHVIKIEKFYFEDVRDNVKPFEVRIDDRGYKVGDVLRLQEIDDKYVEGGFIQDYTGRECRKTISYILRKLGLKIGYVVLGLKSFEDNLEDKIKQIRKFYDINISIISDETIKSSIKENKDLPITYQVKVNGQTFSSINSISEALENAYYNNFQRSKMSESNRTG